MVFNLVHKKLTGLLAKWLYLIEGYVTNNSPFKHNFVKSVPIKTNFIYYHFVIACRSGVSLFDKRKFLLSRTKQVNEKIKIHIANIDYV